MICSLAVPEGHLLYAFAGGKERAMASESFFERVYEVVEQIPEGMIAAYGQVALLAGCPRSTRYVGYALHSNPRPARFPVIAWCLPTVAYARVLPLAAQMLNANFCWGRA